MFKLIIDNHTNEPSQGSLDIADTLTNGMDEDNEEEMMSEEAKLKRKRELEISDRILSFGRSTVESDNNEKTKPPSQESLDILDALTHDTSEEEENDQFHDVTVGHDVTARHFDASPSSEKKRTWSSLWVSEDKSEEHPPNVDNERTWDSLWK